MLQLGSKSDWLFLIFEHQRWTQIQTKNLLGSNLHFTFMWGNEQKPHGSFLIGTSPEFEMAVYTTCILARPGLQIIEL